MMIPQQKNLSYEEYLKLDDDIRVEVLDGQIYDMTPSPTPKHQQVVGDLFTELSLYLRGKSCKVYISPIDVCLSGEDNDLKQVKEWVLPDIVIVCDKNKIGDKRIVGAPDLIVEVLSLATAKKDKLIKYNKYQNAGVKEYWIIDPIHETIDVFLLKNQVFERDGVYIKGDQLPVHLFADHKIDLNVVFGSGGE